MDRLNATERPRKIAIVCRDCGSPEVSRDAWADWDVDRQEWVLGAVMDQGWCHACGEEVKLAEWALVA